jgi:MFS transporter, DHA1 family, multidrug resistance protein
MSPEADAAAQRRRGLNGLLVYTFFMVSGFAMLMPLVVGHFVNRLHMAAALVGTALALRQLLQQGLSVFGGALADRFGLRRMIGAGVLLRAAGFAGLAWADGTASLFAAMTLTAAGGALFEAPYQAAMASLTSEAERPRYYALSNWISGIAATLGPLLGIALLRLDFHWVCLAAAACFVLNYAIAMATLPPLAMPPRPRGAQGGFALVREHATFLLFVVTMAGYWFTAVQMTISFPLLAERLTGSADSVGAMYALSAGMTVLLQYPLVRVLERWLPPPRMLTAGALGVAAGAAITASAQRYDVFLAGIAMFTLGALLARPSQQTLIANMADARAPGTFLGVSSLSLAVGGALGSIVGGWLAGTVLAGRWVWLPAAVFAAMPLFTALGLQLLRRRLPAAVAVAA